MVPTLSELFSEVFALACASADPTSNKNWIFRSENWHLAARFELMVANRNKYDMAQLISWNGAC
jgi:hypothetical protein